MKELLRQRARELGFDDCRFTTAEPPASAPHFQQWLAENQHGEMAWLERNAEKRAKPQKVLAGAKSIIVLAVSYQNEKSAFIPQHPSSGLIARYAQFADYHEIIGERLEQLTQFINEHGGANTNSLWYVDTGPILERDFAQRGGLGFVGKHTNLISRQLGNWFFLAEIITTLKLKPDEPEKNHCGSCTRCIRSCPTQAITAPFKLDARRCISYLTIELKGTIPIELRPLIGNRIYGCDDCLAACPWNRFARAGNLMKPHIRKDLAQPDMLELLQLDDAGFKCRFANTPMPRTKRRGLLRNVSVALGNVGGETALPVLTQAANDKETLIAEHARWAIQQIESRMKQITPAAP
ncbi:MAG: tRNA epoxyqueuosine(34) reductase QueG [Verrucomicrobiota bacterium]